MIQGIDVILTEMSQNGSDPFGRPIYEETEVTVSNVLVAPASTEEVVNELNISGKHIVYTLAIPKGDTHNWEDTIVSFFGKKFKTVGIPTEGIEDLIPLRWNKKVKVELYES